MNSRPTLLTALLLVACGEPSMTTDAPASSSGPDSSGSASTMGPTTTPTSTTNADLSTSGATTGTTGTTGTSETPGTTDTSETTDADTDAEQCPPGAGLQRGEWSSALVYPGDDGYLVYEADVAGNRVPDFGASGYRRGEAEIPTPLVALELGPSGGDDTAAIQAAIDAVGALPRTPGGHRGAVLLAPGLYTVAGTLELRHSGVVLRGAGDGVDPATSTILQAVGDTPHQRSVIVVGSGISDRWKPEVPGTRSDVISAQVPVGARALEVAEPGNFAIGDHVVIVHPCTEAWLTAIQHGATGADEPWTVDSQPLVFKRQITAIDGARLTLDAPVFNTLDRALAQSYVYRAELGTQVREVGVEDLRIDIITKGGADEDHAWSAIAMRGVEDAWVRRVTALHFGFAGVTIATGTQITVEQVEALDPVAELTGGRMYNFDVSGGQQILFTRCRASNGRHHYVSNGTSWTSGVVFHRSTSEGANAASEGHRRWSMGLLYDNVRELAPAKPNKVLLGLYNRGDYGTGHGWAAVHSVAWAYDLADGVGIIQRPPTAQNYAIAGVGVFTGAKPPAPFAQPEGYIEGVGKPGIYPESLYEHQLAERRCRP